MYGQLLQILGRRPVLHEKSTAAFWNDPHVSVGMLKAHLDPHVQGATREHAFVDRSVAWIKRILPPEKYKKLLDLGCGPGLYAERFCFSGYDVTGVDLSERSIAYATERSECQKLHIEYRLEDYLSFSDCDTYDIATLIYCDFGVLPPIDRRTLLHNAFAALKSEGALLLDVFTPREYKNKPEGMRIQYCDDGFWSEEPHALIDSFFRFDDSRDYCDRHIVLTSASLGCYHLWNHAFTVDELKGDLLCAGFARVDFYNDVAGAPYSKNGRTLCAIAYKSV